MWVAPRRLLPIITFATYGTVGRVHVVRYKSSGQLASYGFVEIGSGEQAISAVVALEDAVFEGS